MDEMFMPSKKNFTRYEKEVLKKLVIREKALSARQTDATTNSQKKEAWMRVTKIFCSTPQCSKRTRNQLQKCWSNMKFEYRKNMKQKRKENAHTESSRENSNYIPDSESEDATDMLRIELHQDSDAVFMTEKVSGSSANVTEHRSTSNDHLQTSSLASQDPEEIEIPVHSEEVLVGVGDVFEEEMANGVNNSLFELQCFSDERNDELRERKKTKYTYQQLLYHRKNKMDQIDDLKVELMKKVAAAKERAYKAKEAYYKAKTMKALLNYQDCDIKPKTDS